MNRKWKVVLRSILASVLMALLCSTAAFADESDPTRFVKDTQINGVMVGGMTVEEAKAQVENSYATDYKLTLKEQGNKTEVIAGPEVGYKAVITDGLKAILDAQNAGGRITGPHAGNTHQIQMTGSYDEAALTARIQMLSCISGADIIVTRDAGISTYQEGQPFTIIPEVQGNDVDPAKLTEVVRGSLSIGLTEITLSDWGCYKAAGVKSDDAVLKVLCDRMNQIKDMAITYNFGDNTPVLAGSVISTWLKGAADGQITVDRTQAAAYIATLAAQYDTAGAARAFHTADGRDVNVAGSYGWTLNQEAETEALVSMIQTGLTQTREPEYVNSAASRSGYDWGNTYVEIDLTGQHVYMFKDGAQVWDAPCVTGNVSKDYTTPAGIYSLAYKQTDRMLRGAKQSDGTYEYESHVNYWMPFNGGIGLHDADWRDKFGGTIYKYGGSHGCVNLPPAKAKVLYELVYKGIPVICYN